MTARGKLRGCLCVHGAPERIAASFAPPRPNPPQETYYRRLLYSLALHRLALIVQAIDTFEGGTGKVRRDEHGRAIGRGAGLNLHRQFSEVKKDARLQTLRATILKARSPAYFELLQGAVDAIEHEQGDELENYIRTAPAADLEELPPVAYPAHQGNRRCKLCRRPHPAEIHRFHLARAFANTHPAAAAGTFQESLFPREIKKRFKEEIPF
jgi:hypothetical protein